MCIKRVRFELNNDVFYKYIVFIVTTNFRSTQRLKRYAALFAGEVYFQIDKHIFHYCRPYKTLSLQTFALSDFRQIGLTK